VESDKTMTGYVIFELLKKELNGWIAKQKRGYAEGRIWMLNKMHEKESGKKCLKKTSV